MAFPAAVGLIANGASSLASAGGSSGGYQGGIGSKILGAPGDPLGFGMNLISKVIDRKNNRKAGKEEQKRYDAQKALQTDQWDVQKKMLMQQYIEQQRKQDWIKNFQSAMMSGGK